MKAFFVICGGLLTMICLSALFTLFLYAGWNYGLVEAVPGTFSHISFVTSWWLSVFFSTLGGFFKSNFTHKKD